MSKKISKILCLLMAVVMVACVSAGCSGGTTSGTASGTTSGGTPGGTTSEPEEVILENIDMSKDLGGYSFVLASHWAGIFTPERGATTEGDLILDRVADIETRNKCTIEFVGGTPEEYNQNMQVAAATGIKYADIVLTNLWWYRGMQDIGYFVAWNDIQTINMESTKWMKPAFEYTKEADGKSYGINYSSWEHNMPSVDHVLIFNKDMLAANNVASPYDLIDQGKWTWDTFREMLKTLTKDNDGDGVNDQWGVVSCDRVFEYSVLYSNGARNIYKDENGLYQFGFNTPAAYRAMEFARDVQNVDKTFLDIHNIVAGTGNWMDAQARFKEGNIGFFAYGSNALTWDGWLEDMEDDFGLVYFPNGPDCPESLKYGGFQGGDYQVYSITLGAEDPEKAAYIFNRLTEPLKEGQSVNAWEQYAIRNYFRGDEQGFRYYQNILDTASFAYSPFIGAGNFDLIRNGVFDVVRSQTATPAEAMEPVAAQIQALLDEFYNVPQA